MRSATDRAAMRRGWVWPIRPEMPRAQFEADLGDLGGLARPGLAGDDHDLVSRMAAAISARRAETGSSSGYVMVGTEAALAASWAGVRAANGARCGRSRARGALGRDVFRHVSNCEASRGRSGGGRANVSLASAFAVDAS
jgi:hypothetical protein